MTVSWDRIQGLTNPILVVDGLSGTGKTMISKVLGSLDNFSTPRYFYALEWALQGVKDEAITEDFFKAWVSLLADQLTYDFLVARELNFRPSDLTSVLKAPGALAALGRLLRQDGPQVLEEADPPGLALVTHQSFSGFDALHHALNNRLIWIEMVRRPLDLVTHWASYIERHGSSPSDFTLFKSSGGVSVPWFVDSPNVFTNGNTAEKTLSSLISLYSQLEDFQQETDRIDNVIFIPFESFVVQPRRFMGDVEKATGSSFNRSANRILKRERVPRSVPTNGRHDRAYQRYEIPESSVDIISQAPSRLQDRLRALDEKYVDRYLSRGPAL